MNYRLLLSEMLIDYTERMSLEENSDKRKIYREIIKDLRTALDIEPNEMNILNNALKILNCENSNR